MKTKYVKKKFHTLIIKFFIKTHQKPHPILNHTHYLRVFNAKLFIIKYIIINIYNKINATVNLKIKSTSIPQSKTTESYEINKKIIKPNIKFTMKVIFIENPSNVDVVAHMD